MLDKEKMIDTLNKRISNFEKYQTEETDIRIKELKDLLHVIYKGCFDVENNG